MEYLTCVESSTDFSSTLSKQTFQKILCVLVRKNCQYIILTGRKTPTFLLTYFLCRGVHRVTDLEKFPVGVSKDEAPFLEGCPQGNRPGKISSLNLQDEAPTPLPVVGPLFISLLLFHLSRVLLGAWRFGLFRCVYSCFTTG